MKKNKTKEVSLIEILAVLNFIISIAALILGIIALINDSKTKKSTLDSEIDYYNTDEDFNFDIGEIGDIEDDFSEDDDNNLKF